MIVITLFGRFPSKKNQWGIRRNGSIGVRGNVQKQLDALLWQVKARYRGEPMEHPIMVWTFGLRNRAQDRDNIKTTVLDILVKGGVLKDDNLKCCDGLEITLPSQMIIKGRIPWVEIYLWERGSEKEALAMCAEVWA